MVKPPCINCLVLPMCRSYVYQNPDNHDKPNMIVRHAIHRCEPAKQYTYIHPQKIYHIDGTTSIQNTCDEYRLALLYDYFICLDETTFDIPQWKL